MSVYKSFFTKLAFCLFAAGSFSSLFASALPTCGTASLASYIANTNGCSIGYLDFADFSYTVTSTDATGPGTGLTVTPNGNGFSFGPLNNTGGQDYQFEIDYYVFIDPTPVITGDTLGLDVSGQISVTETFCNDSNYNGPGSGSCQFQASPPTISVGNDVNGLPPTNSITFNPPVTSSQWVLLDFNVAPGASFNGLDAAANISIPEPASFGYAFLGLFSLAAGYKLKKRHNS